MNEQARASKQGMADLQQYAHVRKVLESGNKLDRLSLASDPTSPREALYFLAENGTPQERVAVAANRATPFQADQLLVNDKADEVRGELARKIGRMVPELSLGDQIRLREQMIVILEALAQDQAPKVRSLLVEEIKASPHIPKHIIRRLAEDPELMVCGPILEYSPLLADHDLAEIIAAGRAKEALAHIARRSSVSGDICASIQQTGDVAAISALLRNQNAQIREDTLDAILDGAPAIEAWHEPLALRANLSIRAIRRIAGFVAASLVDKMLAARVVDDALADELVRSVRKRIENAPIDDEESRTAEDDAAWAVSSGTFSDKWVAARLDAGARMEVTYALGFASKLGSLSAKKIVNSRNARTMTALAWKAGLSARTAYDLQQRLANVPTALLLTPKGGNHYPLPESELEWILEAFA
jgi:uncharacterized protein (DUF2336 family)